MNIIFVFGNYSSVLAPEILPVKAPENMWQATEYGEGDGLGAFIPTYA